MSTRGAIGFKADNKWYITYNHSDSYPEYLGTQVLEFCKSIVDWHEWDELDKKVRGLILVDESQLVPDALVEKYKRFSNTDVGRQKKDDWYCLLRNIQGADTLYEIKNGVLQHMIDYHLFLADSLFCEWAYVIDLDDASLKVYKGFNKELYPDTPLPPDIDPTLKDGDYYPVRLLYAYDLARLPEFMLGVTNEFKKQYRLKRQGVIINEINS